MQQAIDELSVMIQNKYPQAVFAVKDSPDDSEIMHLTTIVDVEDADEVLDVVIDRMMELQIDEQLPLFVIPMRPVERALEMMQAQRQRRWPVPQAETSASQGIIQQ